MSEAWKKFILKQDRNKRIRLLQIIDSIISGEWDMLDIKTLEGHPEYFRCRMGDIRIIFSKKDSEILIESIDYRGGAYKNF